MILDYLGSQKVAAEIHRLTAGSDFYTLIMTAFRFADTDNLEKLKAAFPELFDEFYARYNAPGGVLRDSEWRFVEGVKK